MDIKDVINMLRFERELIDSAIESLERLTMAKGRGPGRPAKSEIRSEIKPKKSRRPEQPGDTTDEPTFAAGS
jgi:hypothetical protein